MKIALSLVQDIRFRKEGGGRVKIIIVIKLYLIYYINQVRKKLFVRGGLKCAARPKGPRMEGGGVNAPRPGGPRLRGIGSTSPPIPSPSKLCFGNFHC